MDKVLLDRVKEFVNDKDLSDDRLAIKEELVRLDADLYKSKVELEKLTKATNEKSVEVAVITQRLEGVCQLVVNLLNKTDRATAALSEVKASEND